MTDADLYAERGYVIQRWAFPVSPVLQRDARDAVRAAEAGTHPYGRIYDIPSPPHLYKLDALDHPTALGTTEAGCLYDDVMRVVQACLLWAVAAWDVHFLVTTKFPHQGFAHRDGTMGVEIQEALILANIDGVDQIELAPGSHRLPYPDTISANLMPGDVLIMHPAVLHRGRCEGRRITWHARVGERMPDVLDTLQRLPWAKEGV